MGYTPTDWKKRIVDTPDKYTLVDLGGGLFTITPSEGAVTQEGTPLTEANLNHLETQCDEANADLTTHKTNATPQVFTGGQPVGSSRVLVLMLTRLR